MVNPQLSEYVSAQKLARVTDEEIRKSLLGVGWPKEDVDAAIAMWASPAAAPPPVVNSGIGQNETPNSVFGDGSMINVFDLGMPEKNPVYKPEPQQPEHVVEQSVVPISSDTVAATETRPVDDPQTAVVTAAPPQQSQEVVQQPHAQAKKGSGKLVMVVLVFLVLGAVSTLVWFLIMKPASIPVVPATLTVETSTPIPPTPTISQMSGLASGSALLEGKEFVSSKGFKITQPFGWVAEESGTLGTLVTFSNPNIDEEDGNKFAANINVTAEPAKGLSLDEHIRIGHETLQKTFTSYLKLSEEKVRVDGRDAVMTEATFELGVHSLKVIQLVTVVNDTVYVITGTSFASKFDMYVAQMSASLMSFGV